MKRIRNLMIFALCVMLALAPAVSANSEPTSWEGRTSLGVVVTGVQCPIVVDHENLTFDIQQFPDTYYGTKSALEGYYAATVTAEYTFRNPTDADVTVELLFPYGLMPDYVNVYDEEKTRALEFVESLCGVWADGASVETARRASLHGPYEDFDISESELLHDGFMEHEFYRPDLMVTEYVYEVSGVDKETYDAADWGAELRSDPSLRKILIRDASGWRTEEDHVLIHGGVDHRTETDKFTVYVIGEPFDTQPEWKIYENGACEKVIDGTVTLKHTETMTLLDLSKEHWQERYGISETDWYNAFVQDLSRREFAQGCIDPEVNFRIEAVSMNWYQYELTIPAGETLVNTVTAPMYPDINTAWDPAIYTYQYLLSPAKGWADFGTLDITVKTPFHMTQCNLEGFEETDEGYNLHLDGLPDKELEFVLSQDRHPAKPGSGGHISFVLLGALAGGLIVALRRRSRNKKV